MAPLSARKRIAAVIAGLGLIAVCLVAWMPLPRSVYRAYVLDNPGYFFDRPSFFAERGKTSTLSQLPYLYLDWKFKTDWRRSIQGRIPPGLTPIDRLQWILRQVKPLFLTQNDVYHAPLQTSGLATLVRGYGYCDQINMSLALALEGLAPQVEVWALEDSLKKESPHTVVRVRGEFGTLYMDLWQPVGMFGFDDEIQPAYRAQVPLFSRVSHALQGTFQRSPERVRALYADGQVLNRHDLAFQLGKLWARLTGKPMDVPYPVSTDALTVKPSEPRLKASVSTKTDPTSEDNTLARLGPRKLRQEYLASRLETLWTNHWAPTPVLAKDLDFGCRPDETTCQAAVLFSQHSTPLNSSKVRKDKISAR